MRAVPLVSGLFLVAIASPVLAQNPECSGYVANAQRVCVAAVDATRAFHPVMVVLVSGGNPMIGSAATLGGLGHASLTLRANAVQVVLPDLAYDGSSSTVPAGDKLWAPAPLLEGALGVYGGWDKYTGDAVIQFRDPITNVPQPSIPVELNSSRVLGFLNAGMSLSVVRLTGEVGYQGGKDQNLSTDFEDLDTTKGKFFAGLGLRVGF